MVTLPADVRLYLNRARSVSTPPFSPAPDIGVCLDCGYGEFVVDQRWLQMGWLQSFRPMGKPPQDGWIGELQRAPVMSERPRSSEGKPRRRWHS